MKKPVVIIGGGITGLSAAWELQQHGIDYILLEASGRLGGKIVTVRENGFIIEGGADSFLTTKPAAWQLCTELGLNDRLVGTNDAKRNVFVLRGGKLHLYPPGLRLIVPFEEQGLRESELLSEDGKRRMLAEPGVAPYTGNDDESLASFVRRRYGQEALEVFGESLLAGIYTGDPENLSIKATFPQYSILEKTYGSVTTGLRRTPPLSLEDTRPKSAFVSLKNGMYELVETLESKLTGDLKLGEQVESLEKDGTVLTRKSGSLRASAVLLTVPASAAHKVLSGIFPELALSLSQVRTISSGIVSFGFRESDLPRSLDGFGFVVASNEPTRLRASTWSSTKLPGRAPLGCALIRVFIGGHRYPEDVYLSDEEQVALARIELEKIMGITAVPLITRIFRWIDANTQYEVGHLERIAHLRDLCPPWLQLAGSPYGGIGIPDCVRQGREAAQNILAAPVD